MMRKTAIKIVKTLQDAGHQAVFAGGCVRDHLLALEPKDFDIATDCDLDTVENLLRPIASAIVPVGKQFGVTRVIVDGFEFEIARFREDSKSGDGRHPDSVTFSTMQADAMRRDLTINGMFLEIPAAELPSLTEEELDILFWNVAILFKRGIEDSHVTRDSTSSTVELLPAEIPSLIKERLQF